jgi:hypothetical protein
MIVKTLIHKKSNETTASTSINRKNLFIMKNMYSRGKALAAR